ncbi:MAG: DDE-type integrase/transposase/recombinase [Deltaproteobacteria bacterium]|nr:MAG: DDE-type integrase/transposase/recombinase [Deltaproteobacteria bacterium]
MATTPDRGHERWANLRHSIIGALLAAPPRRGELRAAIEALADKTWQHPITGERVSFAYSTLERWLYIARRAGHADTVTALRRRIRKDAGTRRAVSALLVAAVVKQHSDHPSWSYQLHADNLVAAAELDAALGHVPSYTTVRRLMKERGLFRRKKRRHSGREGDDKSRAIFDSRETRSFECEYVHGLWHLDYHTANFIRSLRANGEWVAPKILGILDDRSRLCCHAQWYFEESAENLIHAVIQGIQKRGLFRALLSDNGSQMLAGETREGLARLGILHDTTLRACPEQNGKQEAWWGSVEGRLLAMLENVPNLTLDALNHATQAWVEMEYNRRHHSEIGEAPAERFLRGPSVGRPSPSAEELRLAFRIEETRTQRRSDGTVSIDGVRFEVPSRYRHLERMSVRYASWDLGRVHLVDARTGTLLTPLYPLDRAKNADGVRRVLGPVASVPVDEAPPAKVKSTEMAPLLRRLIDDYDRAGLPPAYLPKNDEPTVDDKEND